MKAQWADPETRGSWLEAIRDGNWVGDEVEGGVEAGAGA